MGLPLGVIADDFTGATDIAGFMVQSGWRVVQLTEVPAENTPVPDEVDAIVISLKSRSCPAEDAIEQALRACDWLRNQAVCRQIYFKYCSTFDSTEHGNIGPVTDALMQALQCDFTLVCPALPINGRTVVYGHLFVNGCLLNESGMQHHPITPMREANLLRLMERQSRGKAGLIRWDTLQQGEDAIKTQVASLMQQGVRYGICDALNQSDLLPLAKAALDFPLLTGGSGLGAALASISTGQPLQPEHPVGFTPARAQRRTVVLSGSCSQMTHQQVTYYRTVAASKQLDIARAIEDPSYARHLAEWCLAHVEAPWAPLLFATQPTEELKETQARWGAQASEAVEQVFAAVARQLAQAGINTFIVAGGETSGVVVRSLECKMLRIGAPITPGVPWVEEVESGYCLALKSGNFGEPTFFQTAQEIYHD